MSHESWLSDWQQQLMKNVIKSFVNTKLLWTKKHNYDRFNQHSCSIFINNFTIRLNYWAKKLLRMALVLGKYSLFHIDVPLHLTLSRLTKKKLKVYIHPSKVKSGKDLPLIGGEFAIVSWKKYHHYEPIKQNISYLTIKANIKSSPEKQIFNISKMFNLTHL